MHQAGDATEGAEKLYFDAYMMQNHWPAYVTGSTTPNVPGSRLMPVNWYHVHAMLGFWVDCNNDGFIGSALTGQTTYSDALETVDTTKCQDGGMYYQNGQVDEFRAVIRTQVQDDEPDPREIDYDVNEDGDEILKPAGVGFSMDPNDVIDPEAKIWGDWMTPDQEAVPSQGILPLPPKTLTTYHGHFKYVDDATLGDLSATVGEDTYYGIPATLGDNADVYDLREGDSPLAYARYAYNSSTSGQGGDADCGHSNDCTGAYAQPFIVLFDCTDSQGTTIDVPAEAEQYTGGDIYTAPVSVGKLNADGSIDGTLRQNERAIDTEEAGECDDPQDGVNWVFYSNLEIAEQDSSVNSLKVSTDFTFFPRSTNHLRSDGSVLPANSIAKPHNGYCGVVEVTCSTGDGDAYWESSTVWSRRPPRAMWGVTQTLYMTNYVDVSDATFVDSGASAAVALPSGDNAGAYGEEQCSSFASGVESYTKTWSCDPEAWNVDASSPHILGYVGDAYDLRDEDCFDGSLQPGLKFAPTDDC